MLDQLVGLSQVKRAGGHFDVFFFRFEKVANINEVVSINKVAFFYTLRLRFQLVKVENDENVGKIYPRGNFVEDANWEVKNKKIKKMKKTNNKNEQNK